MQYYPAHQPSIASIAGPSAVGLLISAIPRLLRSAVQLPIRGLFPVPL